MDEIIKLSLKEWLKLDAGDQTFGEYVRVYYYPDKGELILLRHIEETTKTQLNAKTTIRYSVITKINGDVHYYYVPNGFNSKENKVFNFHSYNLPVLLELLCLKKKDRLLLEYYYDNESQYTKERDIKRETVIIGFEDRTKKRYRIDISQIVNSDLVRFMHYDQSQYASKKLYDTYYGSGSIEE
jgi:hypothetical protein